MTSGADWEDAVGRNWAKHYARTDRSFAGLTEHLLGRIGTHPGKAVLDIGCGAGELSLAIARARPHARVLGLDVSPELIAAVRERAGERGNVRFELRDAAAWHEQGYTPDLLVSRHGVMFFDDPPAAFAHLRDIADPDASLVFSCFRTARENRWASDIPDLLGLPALSSEGPGPFSFADPQLVEAILSAAGWAQVDFEPVDFAWIAGKGDDPVADALDFVSRIGPAAPALRALEGDDRAAAEAKLRGWFEEHRSGDIVAFAAAAWIVTASANRRHRTR